MNATALRTGEARGKVHFPSGGTFHAELRRRVTEYFDAPGRTVHGGGRMRAKTVLLFAWLIGSYLALLFAPVTALTASLLTVSLALAMAGIGFGVMHDANHGSYSPNAGVNRALALSCDLLGASSHLWRQKHNVLHHTYTNVSGLDPDLESGAPLLRVAPWMRRRWFHRFQHVYVWVLYALFLLKWWFVDDARELATGRIAGQPFPKPRGRVLFEAIAGKALFLAWAFVLPALLHPTWALVPLWLLGSATLGIVLAVVFQLAHCMPDAEFHAVESGQRMETDWAAHQVATTVDFAPRSAVLGWYLGGLNFQIEHHLFPKVCHVHYPALSRIVRETCREHGVPYRAEPSIWSALASNLRWLRAMGTA